MKTLAQILVIAGLASFVACGPSAEQKAEQARLDSIKVADSIAMVEAAEQARMDSINAAMAADTTMMETETPAE
jgi:predicted outer membrane protein